MTDAERETLVRATAELRHAYLQAVGGHIKNQVAFARGLLGPQIEKLERLAGAAALEAQAQQEGEIARLRETVWHVHTLCPGCWRSINQPPSPAGTPPGEPEVLERSPEAKAAIQARYRALGITRADVEGTPPVGETALTERLRELERTVAVPEVDRLRARVADLAAELDSVLSLSNAKTEEVLRLRAQVTALEQERDEAARFIHAALGRLRDYGMGLLMPDQMAAGVEQLAKNGIAHRERAKAAEHRAEQAEATLAQAQAATWREAAQMAGAWAHAIDNPLDLRAVILRELDAEMLQRATAPRAGEKETK